MLNPHCIRIFRTQQEADWAKKLLKEGGIVASVSKDYFNGVPIEKFGVHNRFRLIIEREDVKKAAKFLSEKLRKKRKS